jgi:hypothetical protein
MKAFERALLINIPFTILLISLAEPLFALRNAFCAAKPKAVVFFDMRFIAGLTLSKALNTVLIANAITSLSMRFAIAGLLCPLALPSLYAIHSNTSSRYSKAPVSRRWTAPSKRGFPSSDPCCLDLHALSGARSRSHKKNGKQLRGAKIDTFELLCPTKTYASQISNESKHPNVALFVLVEF